MVPAEGSDLYVCDVNPSHNSPEPPLPPSARHAFVPTTGSGTRRSLESAFWSRKSSAAASLRIWPRYSSVFVQAQYRFQQSKAFAEQFPGSASPGGDGNLLEWQLAHRSANTILPRA